MNAPMKSPFSSDWILCSSKSFPGKSYYFNVLTGEAVWTLSDHEKNLLKKENNIQKINTKFHGYPEPTTHPDHASDISNIWPNTPSSHWQDYQRPSFQTKTFGPSSQMSNQYMPLANTVMMPVQWPAPMWPYLAPDSWKPTTDKVTQTSNDKIVESSGIPLCKRFVNYETPSICFDKENKMINKESTSNQKNICNKKTSRKEVLAPESISDNCHTKSKELIQNNMANLSLTLNKNEVSNNSSNLFGSKKSCQMHKNVQTIDITSEVQDPQERDLTNLDSSDLRFLLVAKRRQIKDECEDPIEKKKLKFQEPTPPKKKVTFDVKALNDICLKDDSDKITTYEHLKSSSPFGSNVRPHTPLSLSKLDKNINIPYNTRLHVIPTENVDTDNMSTEDGIQTPTNSTPTKENIEMCTMPTMKDVQTYVSTSDNAMEQEQIKTKSSSNKCNEDVNSFTDKNIIEDDISVLKEVSASYTAKNVWFVVADMDVLLDGHAIIEQILKSYESSRLLIPYSVRGEIESLCTGDYRMQQRVLVARQLSRRLAVPHGQYVLEPPLFLESNPINIADAILKCCMRAVKNNYYLVLITNDPYLINRAKICNIRCYTLQEIKNGAIINPKSFSGLKRLNMTIDNVTEDKNEFMKNKLSNIFSKRENFANIFRKPSPRNNDIRMDKNDLLINITKPKSLNNQDNYAKSDKITSDINKRMQVLNIKNTSDCAANYPFILQKENQPHNQNIMPPNKNNNIEMTSKNDNSHNFKSSNILSQNARIQRFLEKVVPNKLNIDNNEKPSTMILKHLKGNEGENVKKTNPITDNKRNCTSETENSQKDKTNALQEKLITTPTRHRIEKILGAVNPNDFNEASNSAKVFKIPNLKGTIFTSTPIQSSTENEQSRSNFKKPDVSVSASLKNFCMGNKLMHENIKNKLDELICTYTQIMEELLRDILQLNCEYTAKTSAPPINLHESLTCIKMLYDNVRLRDIIEVLLELLTKHSCGKGKLKLDINPQEFMKLVGCGVLLVETLKTVLPSCEILLEYENSFETLLNNMENQKVELDPEFLRPTNVCRSEINEATKPRVCYRKESAYVVDYLKKHYKEWSNHGQSDNSSYGKPGNSSNQEDFKVVRMIGKNISMVKIDINKSMSYKDTSTNTEIATKEKAKTKIRRLLDNDKINITTTNDNVDFVEKETVELKSREILIPIVFGNTVVGSQESHKITRNKDPKENYSDTNPHSNINYINIHPDTEKAEVPEPEIIRNTNVIENMKSKEPLDLDMLDYSEINTVTTNDFSNKSNQNDDVTRKSNEHANNLNDKEIQINEDSANNKSFYALSKDDRQNTDGQMASNNKMLIEDKDYATNDYKITSPKEQQKITSENLIHEDIEYESNHADSVDIHDIYGSRKNSTTITNINYGNENHTIRQNYATNNDDYFANDDLMADFDKFVIGTNNCLTNDENYAMANDSGAIDENYAADHSIYQANYENNAENQTITRDDSMNDSGFENESTLAYTVVKVFLGELGATFKVIHEFITNFVTEINGEAMCEQRKNLFHIKASRCLQEMVALILQLKCIMQRESHEITMLKSLLLKPRTEALNDKRVIRYRLTLRKCLEQAQILEGALRIIVSITVGDAISSNAESVCSSIRYINIFE